MISNCLSLKKDNALKYKFTLDEGKKFDLLFDEVEKNRQYILTLLDSVKTQSDDQYRRINTMYNKLFNDHFDAFLMMVHQNQFNSAIVIARTLMEIYIRSCYIEFIEKTENTDIKYYLDDQSKIKPIFAMCTELDEFEHPDFNKNNTFSQHFKQFTKQGLAQYQKFSFFSHGRGELAIIMFENPNIAFCYQDVEDVVVSMLKMFNSMALLFMTVQNRTELIPQIVMQMVNTENNLDAHQIGTPEILGLVV